MGWKSGEATSVRNSNAVLSASAVQTDVMASAIQHHSLTDNLTTRPPAMTRTVAVACSQALCWVLSMVAMPRTANFTLRSRPVNVSGFDGVRSILLECAHPSTRIVGTPVDHQITRSPSDSMKWKTSRLGAQGGSQRRRFTIVRALLVRVRVPEKHGFAKRPSQQLNADRKFVNCEPCRDRDRWKAEYRTQQPVVTPRSGGGSGVRHGVRSDGVRLMVESGIHERVEPILRHDGQDALSRLLPLLQKPRVPTLLSRASDCLHERRRPRRHHLAREQDRLQRLQRRVRMRRKISIDG